MDFLSVIVDCQLANWANEVLHSKQEDTTRTYQLLTASIMGLCNSHLLASLSNNLLLLVSGTHNSVQRKKLFSSKTIGIS